MQQNGIKPTTHLIEEQKFFSGPIPSPDVMMEYKQIDSNFPNRIITMAEKQQNHRIAMERKDQKIYPVLLVSGQVFGFLLAVIALIGSFYLILKEKDTIGVSTLIGSVATLIGVYMYGRKQESPIKEVKKNISKP